MTTEIFLKSFGEDLMKQRVALRLDRSDLAEHLGVTVRSIKNWEDGKASMSVITERRIEAYFRTVREARAAKKQLTGVMV